MYLSLTTYISICGNVAKRLIIFVSCLEETLAFFMGLMPTSYFWKSLAADMKK